MGYAGNFTATTKAVPLGKVASPQAMTEGVYTAYIHAFSPLLHKCLQNRFNFTDYYAQVLTFRFVQTILSAFPESAMNRIPSGQSKLYCID